MKKKKTFFKQARTLLVASFAIATPSMSNAEESAQDGLQRCGLISDMSARVVCYDQLGGRENSAVEKVTPSPALPPDELGAESLTGHNSKRAEPLPVTVKVTKCSKRGGNKKYILYLEGGQVWKQISDKRLNFRDCNFSASIIKDFFGYKMHLENSNHKLRVKRIR
jgi:hypothetical protein